MVKCPYCDSEGGFEFLKEWRYRFYRVVAYRCPKCNGKFNYYRGVSPKGRQIEYTIRVKPRARRSRAGRGK
jgi:transposase-like protein